MSSSWQKLIVGLSGVPVHALFAWFVLSVEPQEEKKRTEIELEMVPLPPSPPPPEVPKPVEPAPAKLAQRAPEKPDKPTKAPPARKTAAPPDPDPAPKTNNPTPPTYQLDPGEVAAATEASGNAGSPAVVGQPGGTGKGTPNTKPGAPGGRSDGAGGVLTPGGSLAKLPEPIGETDYFDAKRDYPKEALAARMEGPVRVKIIVLASGQVGRVSIEKSLGFGLDQLALRLAKKLRFRPAKDASGSDVSTEIPWTFRFVLPE